MSKTEKSKKSREACPECNSIDLYIRIKDDADEKFRCRNCGHAFNDPDMREVNPCGSQKHSTTVKKLMEADKDDYP